MKYRATRNIKHNGKLVQANDEIDPGDQEERMLNAGLIYMAEAEDSAAAEKAAAEKAAAEKAAAEKAAQGNKKPGGGK